MRISIVLFSILLVFLTTGTAAAQQNVTSATLTGRIEDNSGAVVSGASVTAIHVETNQRLTTMSDQEAAIASLTCGLVITTSKSTRRAFHPW